MCERGRRQQRRCVVHGVAACAVKRSGKEQADKSATLRRTYTMIGDAGSPRRGERPVQLSFHNEIESLIHVFQWFASEDRACQLRRVAGLHAFACP